MTELGRYADGRSFTLPNGWVPASDEVLETATAQAMDALAGEAALQALSRYYDRGGSYTGTLFLDVSPNHPDRIEAADLYAVTTLSMRLDARHGRLLLEDHDTRARVERGLRGLSVDLPITDLDHGDGGSAETLLRMYELHAMLRDLLSENSSRWVTAAKLCARKRPLLFPVRDNLVCEYLAGGRRLRSGDSWPGDFSIDIQVYAYFMTNKRVRAALAWISAELDRRSIRHDEISMRLLDSALWMAATRDMRPPGEADHQLARGIEVV